MLNEPPRISGSQGSYKENLYRQLRDILKRSETQLRSECCGNKKMKTEWKLDVPLFGCLGKTRGKQESTVNRVIRDVHFAAEKHLALIAKLPRRLTCYLNSQTSTALPEERHRQKEGEALGKEGADGCGPVWQQSRTTRCNDPDFSTTASSSIGPTRLRPPTSSNDA